MVQYLGSYNLDHASWRWVKTLIRYCVEDSSRIPAISLIHETVFILRWAELCCVSWDNIWSMVRPVARGTNIKLLFRVTCWYELIMLQWSVLLVTGRKCQLQWHCVQHRDLTQLIMEQLISVLGPEHCSWWWSGGNYLLCFSSQLTPINSFSSHLSPPLLIFSWEHKILI